jgi:hypothetical protein
MRVGARMGFAIAGGVSEGCMIGLFWDGGVAAGVKVGEISAAGVGESERGTAGSAVLKGIPLRLRSQLAVPSIATSINPRESFVFNPWDFTSSFR